MGLDLNFNADEIAILLAAGYEADQPHCYGKTLFVRIPCECENRATRECCGDFEHLYIEKVEFGYEASYKNNNLQELKAYRPELAADLKVYPPKEGE